MSETVLLEQHRSTSYSIRTYFRTPDSNSNSSVSDPMMYESSPVLPIVTELRKQFRLGPKTDEPVICAYMNRTLEWTFEMKVCIVSLGLCKKGSWWRPVYSLQMLSINRIKLNDIVLLTKYTLFPILLNVLQTHWILWKRCQGHVPISSNYQTVPGNNFDQTIKYMYMFL